MPVAPSSNHAGRALAVAGIGIAIVLAALWGAAVLYSHKNPANITLGDQTFGAGSAKSRAAEIRKGGPILLPDASPAHDRDVLLQHLGTNVSKGWYGIAAQPVGKPRTCTWQWNRAQQVFHAACDPSLTLPADGAGAKQYPVTVDGNGKLTIDLNAAERPTTTTTSTPRTTVIITGQKPSS